MNQSTLQSDEPNLFSGYLHIEAAEKIIQPEKGI
jgi:hypothetical protein